MSCLREEGRHDSSIGHASYLFCLLSLLMFFNFVDRYIIAALLPYIRLEWTLSDTQLGLIVSVVNLAVAGASIPAAILVDRWSRTKILGVMAIIWTCSTLAGAFTKNFSQLLLARFFVGIGEGGYAPGATSVLAALYPNRYRSTVLGVFYSTATIGAVVGISIGGGIAEAWGWRFALVIVPIPGLLFAVLLFFARDHKTIDLNVVDRESGGTRKMFRKEAFFSLVTTPALLAACVGSAAHLFFVATVMSWLPSFFNRVYGLPGDEASLQAAYVMAFSAFGAAVGGYLVDKWTTKRPARRMLGPAILSLCTSVLFVLAFSQPHGASQSLLIFLAAFVMLGTLGPIAAVTQDVVHPGLRATAAGILVFCQNFFGMALGPIAAGMISDEYDLLTSLSVISLAPIFAAFVYFLGALFYQRDVAKVARSLSHEHF